ncbi:MAG: 50S ribosomal protein L21e [Thermoplasmata archaeon]|uniref:Large ribosomal subunit protein eL21 n=1 Tax=Candidatus Sysuiplasma superficiale TaxID=2823368 RepID=A0A8J8CDH8_9ARCH|nr:50S ribosomal protein L21e [Candidatus Sysuiplasma superficiale]MBX8644559.1 50S ribosomal protein L21e [Candidatus Sysuiplasma superficiale]
MVKSSKGLRRRSRGILSKSPRERGMPPVARIIREFQEGESVSIRIEPSIRNGAPHIRFQGRTGRIVGRQGRSYKILISDGGKEKVILSEAVHLMKAK